MFPLLDDVLNLDYLAADSVLDITRVSVSVTNPVPAILASFAVPTPLVAANTASAVRDRVLISIRNIVAASSPHK